MAVIGALVTDVSADTTKFSRGMDQATGRVSSFARDVSAIVGGIAIADIGSKIVGGLFSAGKGMVGLAAEAETMRIEMEVLTGSAKTGGDMFKRLEKFAQRTSFTLTSAAEAATQLMAKGIPADEVMDTMTMLGNLARGNSEKLQLIAKAYTDVRAKGKLMAQETNQFAENGVNIFDALAKSTGKNVKQLIEMREAGQITFDMVQKAMQEMTGEGGRFGGMMDRINNTFTGQFNSLVESIQAVGRELGEAVLPQMKSLVEEANKFVGLFQAMGDQKWTWLSDVLIASFDVAMEYIKFNWKKMLNEMVDGVASIPWHKMLNPFAGVRIDDLRQDVAPANLDAAKQRLQGFVGEAKAREAAQRNAEAAQAAQDKRLRPKAAAGGDLIGAVKGFADKLAPFAGDIVDEAKRRFESGKMTANWLMETGKRMFTGDPIKKQEPQLAGAMERGSSEAFSTVVRAMLNGKKDHAAEAVKKQTKELKQPLVEIANTVKDGLFNVIEAFS
jgi:tape measure domain-containing protein